MTAWILNRHMKTALLAGGAIACMAAGMFAQARINPTDPQPTCEMCPGTYIPLSELDAYTKKAMSEKLVDQQVRDIEIGKAHVGIGMVYRTKLEKPQPDSVAEHDHVSEVYHIISGTATLMLGPDITNRERRPATQQTVREFNGPGNNGSSIRNGVSYNLKPGDVVTIKDGSPVRSIAGPAVTRMETPISAATCATARPDPIDRKSVV